MNGIHFEIQGKPIAKQRPRFVNRASKKAYNPQQEEEERWIWEVKTQIPYAVYHKPLTGPILLRVKFLMPIPKSFSKAKIQMIENGIWIPHVKKPDLDNLVKWAKDCCNGWLWKDDSQVYRTKALKIYGVQAKTLIEVIEIEGFDIR